MTKKKKSLVGWLPILDNDFAHYDTGTEWIFYKRKKDICYYEKNGYMVKKVHITIEEL